VDKTDKELAKSMRRKKKKKAKKSKGKNVPANPELYSRVKSEAKKKFDVYPSAYANAWLVKTYKKRGGTYTTKKA
jgi:hypothetical protein